MYMCVCMCIYTKEMTFSFPKNYFKNSTALDRPELTVACLKP